MNRGMGNVDMCITNCRLSDNKNFFVNCKAILIINVQTLWHQHDMLTKTSGTYLTCQIKGACRPSHNKGPVQCQGTKGLSDRSGTVNYKTVNEL